MKLFSSIALRQAAVTAVVVLAAVAVLAVAVMVGVERTDRATTLRTIDTDLAGLVDVAVQGGPSELAHRIEDRLAVVSKSDETAHYLLRADSGKRLAGDMVETPPVDAAHSANGEVTVDGERMLVRATRLKPGVSLYVGRSLAPVERAETELRWRLGYAAAAAVTGALLVGLFTAWRLGRRAQALNAVFRRFQEGDQLARAGSQGSDEFGELAANVDTHLGQIAQLLAVQREISSNIAHELRTPLAHLDTRLRRALDATAEAATREVLERARDDIRSIVSLFDALLDIALGEAMEGGARGVVDLSEVGSDLADLYRASAEEAGLDFAVAITPGVTLRGERMQLTRMIANLLDNAVKFVPAGASVRLTVGPGPVVTVEDSGPGVAPADRDLIFRRFGRVSTDAAGHGLGLALVKVIATRHGLAARCEDAGPGARFVVAPA